MCQRSSAKIYLTKAQIACQMILACLLIVEYGDELEEKDLMMKPRSDFSLLFLL
jgi:hypothetical protein